MNRLTLLGQVSVEVLLGPEAGGQFLGHVALGALGLFDHAVEIIIKGRQDSQR